MALVLVALTKRARLWNRKPSADAAAAAATAKPEEPAPAPSMAWLIVTFPLRAVYALLYFALSILFGPLPVYRTPQLMPDGSIARTTSGGALAPVRWALSFVFSIVTSPLVLLCLIVYLWFTFVRVYTMSKNVGYNYGMLHKTPLNF
jgi:hypothetical protein